MTEKELNNKNNQAIEASESGVVSQAKLAPKASSELKNIEDLRLKHDNEKAEWKKQKKQLVDANIDWEDRFEKLEDALEQREIEKKALEKAYWRERNRGEAVTVLDGPESEDEGKLISRKVKDILLKRCAEGRYGDFNCATGTLMG